MRKLFTLFVALLATTCLWAQCFQVGDLYYQVVNRVIPHVNNPGYGRTTVVLYIPENTPAGCYAVGTVNGWDINNTDLMFTPVADADNERWVACTFDYAEDMRIKVCAIPSDPAVAPGWSFQWGRNMDGWNDLEEDNVVILEGIGYMELENSEPKLVELADNGVVYIEVKDWASNPYIEPIPCETAAFKHPWGGGDWIYREATKTAEGIFELNALYGGVGISVATDVYGYCETWYPEDQIEFVGDVAQGDYVNFKFVSEKGTFVGRMIVTLIEKGTAPENPETPGEAKDITVKAKVPATWTETITAWVWPTGGEGKEVTPTKEGDWYVYTENCAELNIIFKNGEGWWGDEYQTVDMKFTESACVVLESDGDNKATYTYVDCDNPWYLPSKKSPMVSQKHASTNSHPQVVVTYQPESSDNYAYLSTAYIPETVVYKGKTYEVVGIDEYAFANSPISSITIPNSVTSIGNGAFNGCKSLTSITIPNSVTNIGSGEYKYGYWEGLFSGCSSLKSIIVKEGNPVYDSRNHCNAIVETATNTLVVGCQSTNMPSSITSIGQGAFAYCTSLTSIYIPNSVTSIGGSAFSGCSSLNSITIPNSVTSIGNSAFRNCQSLTSITIPNSVTSIEEGAFSGCSSLTSVTINSNAIVSKDYSSGDNISHIFGSQVTEYIIGNKVKGIGNYAFYKCFNLTSLTIPNSVTSIGSYAFYDCSSTECIFYYNNTPPNISYDTFSNYNATLYVPSDTKYRNHSVWYQFEKIVSMGDERIFTHDGLYYETISTESILSVYLSTQENFNKFTPISILGSQYWYYDSKYGAKMNGYSDSYQRTYPNEDWLISPALNLSNYLSATLEFSHAFGPVATLPTTDTQKAQYTCWVSNNFNGDVTTATWTELPITYGTSAWSFITTSVDIPAENLKENCHIAWKYVCEDESATWEIKQIEVTARLKQTQVKIISGPNKYLGDIVVPATVMRNDTIYNVVTIGGSAFSSCSALTSITIPNSVTSIGGSAFFNCSALTSITIPNSVTRIGDYAFFGCSSLTSVTIPNSVTSIGYSAFSICDSLTKTNYTGDIAGWCDIKFGDYQANPIFYSENLYINNQEVKDLVIPNTVDSIHDNAFSGCSSFTSITIPNNVTSIGDWAFYKCSSLTFVTIPNSVTHIGDDAFYKCSSLTSVTIGNGVTNIGNWAFSSCYALNEVTLGTGVKTIGADAFKDCTKLYDVYCYAAEPPTTSESSFENYNAFLHVPCESQRLYLLDINFGNFKYIECVSSDEVSTDGVVVTPSTNDVTIIWPTETGADTYTIVIKKGDEVFCTLTFNADGQLLNIAFAPGRDGNHPAQYAEQAGNGYRFTVTGLTEATRYAYDITTKDASNQTLATYSGEFTTMGGTTTDVDNIHSPITNCQKIIRNGQLLILRDGVEYTIMGQEL